MAFKHHGLTVLEPDDWRMRWARPPIATANPSWKGYLHHTAGNYVNDAAQAFYNQNEAAIREGMSATDYSLLVHRNRVTGICTLGIARGGWLPAATRDENTESKAVCALGYYQTGHALSEEPTSELVYALAVGFDVLAERGWLRPDAWLLPHRANPDHPGATQCPGNLLIPHLPEIDRLYRTFQGSAPMPDPDPIPPSTGGSVLLYKVVSGDSWWRICEKVFEDGAATMARVGLLQKANPGHINLRPGDIIKIPGRIAVP